MGVDRQRALQKVGARVKQRKRRNAFRQAGADRETRYTLEPAAARHVKVQTDDRSPSAREFRLLLNGLAPFCAETDLLPAMKVRTCDLQCGRSSAMVRKISWVTRGAGSGQHLASVLQEGRENANIDAGLGIGLENLG